MKSDQVYCVLDFETYSEADLKKVGAYEYSMDYSTEVLCVSFRVGTKAELPTAKTWTSTPDTRGFSKFLEVLEDEEIILVAHNAFFDHMILENVLAISTPFERWQCTAAMAATLALPRKLEDVCDVLQTEHRKDKEGNRLIKKWCKPRKPTKKNSSTRHTDKEEFERILKYCESDIAASVDVFLALPQLSADERKIWLLDQKMNFRGFRVDRKLIRKCQKMIGEEQEILAAEAKELTEGAINSTSQTVALRAYLDKEGLFLPDLQAATIEDALESGLAEGVCKRLLEIRQQESLTSLAKYDVAERCSRYDGRIRDTAVYHGASTGRWAGRGFQPHNLKKCDFDMLDAIDFLKSGDVETLRLFYGDVLPTISSCIRGVVVPAKGHILDIADYNAIEVRVLFWVAQHRDGLQALREGRDLYKSQAASVFKIQISKISDDGFERFIGKQLILGCGYGMGWKKFVAQCLKFGKVVAPEIAKLGVETYRKDNSAIPTLWRKLEKAAVDAVLAGDCNRYQQAACTRWYMEGDFLYCELPNGRKLAYYGPRVRYETDQWDRKRPVLYHWGIDSKTKKWVIQKTWGGTLTENVVQAIARDLVADAALRTE